MSAAQPTHAYNPLKHVVHNPMKDVRLTHVGIPFLAGFLGSLMSNVLWTMSH